MCNLFDSLDLLTKNGFSVSIQQNLTKFEVKAEFQGQEFKFSVSNNPDSKIVREEISTMLDSLYYCEEEKRIRITASLYLEHSL